MKLEAGKEKGWECMTRSRMQWTPDSPQEHHQSFTADGAERHAQHQG